MLPKARPTPVCDLQTAGVWPRLLDAARGRRRRTTRSPGACSRAPTRGRSLGPGERTLPVRTATAPSRRALGIFLEALDVAAAARGLARRGRAALPVARVHGAEAAAAARACASAAERAAGFAGRAPAPAADGARPLRRPACAEAALAELAGDRGARSGTRRGSPATRELVDWVVGLNADTLFYDLDEDDRRAEIGHWTHSTDRGRSAPATASRRPAWASRRRSSGCSSATTACCEPGRCAPRCAASTCAGCAARRLSAGSPGPGDTPEDWLDGGRMLMRFWLALTAHGLYLQPFGSVITNPTVARAPGRAARRRRRGRRDLAAPADRLLRRAASQRPPPGRGGDLRELSRCRRALVFGFLHAAAAVRWRSLAAPARASSCCGPGLEPVLWRIGELAAWLAVEQARKHVPAYRRVPRRSTASREVTSCDGLRPDFSAIPITDKENYVSAGRSRSGAATAGSRCAAS